jgi:hypothetical protein
MSARQVRFVPIAEVPLLRLAGGYDLPFLITVALTKL